MNNLQPEQRADRNGKVVTRHVRSDTSGVSAARIGGIAVPLSAQATNDALEQDFDTLEEFMANPSEADRERAMASLVIDIGNVNSSRKWSSVMGANTNMTTKNLADYDQKQREFINDNIEAYRSTLGKKAQFESKHSAYARAYFAGVATEFDESFDKIWKGEIDGFGENNLNNQIAGHRMNLEDIKTGKISAYQIVGGGYKNPKRIANEWLENQIASIEEALRTHGRSDSVNISNVQWYKRKEQEK